MIRPGPATWNMAQAIFFGVAIASPLGCHPSPSGDDTGTTAEASPTESPAASGRPAVSFNKHIAPLVWEKCANCHRPGEAAPFSLITYRDVATHAQQIVEVTQSGFMPPWLADSEYPFENDLRLAKDQIALLEQWVDAGAPEGDPEDSPTAPNWVDGWGLGKPDLVVTMSEPFVMPADGPDVYRNFVVPIPVDSLRYVRAMEFRPGNYKIVHHAFMLIDPTRRLRGFEEEDELPGFEGMETRGATAPDGHFIGWQPGRRPYEAPAGMAWRLYPGTDLVLQIHIQPSGKEEPIRASVGFYFTDEPPRHIPIKAVLRSVEIDIPPGVSDYSFEDDVTLPIDVTLLAVAPHAHYLGKEMYGVATFPDGSQKTLLEIKDWDLNWQREYRYAEPIFLPKGTKLTQRFVYDNSSANVRNPHNPPQRVRYGLQATDEMGSLWFQLLPHESSQRKTLELALIKKTVAESYGRHTSTLRHDPGNVHANIELGKIALMMKRYPQAIQLFRRATESDPASPDAHYYLGTTLLRSGSDAPGRKELQQSLNCDPQYVKAHHDLGWADYLAGKLDQAEQRFQTALEIHPHDTEVLENLGMVYYRLQRYQDALSTFERALEIRPDDEKLKQQVRRTRQKL